MAVLDPRPLDENPDESIADGGPRPLATFGRYLLFRRLKRDELGEVYRAGRRGGAAVERMALLRLFNAAEIDGERFWQACQDRVELRTALQGGQFARVVDLGCENGVAFVAHELVLGRSLADLLAQARDASEPVPLAHALYVMDRIAIGLQNAAETRLDDKRIVHGFLIPDCVHVSSEGEIRLGGFESTGGLLDLSPTGPARARLAVYLSPEVNAGQPPRASDDVYSMGAILAELLTGEPPTALDSAAASRWLDGLRMAAGDAPIPDGIRRLLSDSLQPRDERIQSAEQWHRALLEASAGGSPASATFDLAFFMHTLFGDALEQEAGLVEAEMRAEIPPPPAPAAETPEPEPEPAPEPETASDEVLSESAAPEAAELADDGPALDPLLEPLESPAPARRTVSGSRSQSAPPEATNRKWIAAGAAALVLLALGGAYLIFGRSRPDSEAPAPLLVTAAVGPEESALTPLPVESDGVVDGIAEVAPPLSPEELESQVRSLVAERAGDLEANLKAEYDQRLVELRRQLEEARKAAPRASGPATAAATAAPAAARPAPAENDSAAVSSPAGRAPATAPGEPRAEPAPPASTSRPPSRPVEVEPPPESSVSSESSDEIVRQPEPAPAREAAPAADPEPRQVEAGSIVTNGPGVTAPRLVRQPNVVYPPAAARLKRQATVRVRILVDEQGRPSEIEQVSKKVGLGFDAAAQQAARTTRWTAPEKDGVPVKMWVELSIDFRQ